MLKQALQNSLLVLILLSTSSIAFSDNTNTAKARTVIVLDASGSMWGQIDGKNKIVIAREVIAAMMDNWDPGIHVGLVAYGHRSEGDCNDIEALLPVAADSAAQLSDVVNSLNPKGKTPLSAAVQQAAESLRYTEQPATVILVTDGLETCDMDPCALGKTLAESGVDFTSHVVGFDLEGQDTSAIQCLAESTGGQFLTAADATTLTNALGAAVQQVQQQADADTLWLKLSDDSEILKGVTVSFEYYVANADGSASENRASYEYSHVGRPTLEAGNYVASIALGSIHRYYPFSVSATEKTEHTVVLDGGTIKLNAILDEGTVANEGTLSWTVYPVDDSGQASSQHITFAYDTSPLFYLPSGTYDVHVSLGAASASQRQTITAGDTLEATLDLRAGHLLYNASFTENGDLLNSTASWEVYHYDATTQTVGKRASYAYGATGTFVLTAGSYRLDVTADTIVRSDIVEVTAGEDTNHTIVLNGGYLQSNLLLVEGGEPIQGTHSWEAYVLNDDGSPGQRLTYTYAATVNFLVPEGNIRLAVSSGAASAFGDANVNAGETTSTSLVLNAGYINASFTDSSDTTMNSGTTSWGVYAINDDDSTGNRITYTYSHTPQFLVPAGKIRLKASNDKISGSADVNLKAGETQTIVVKASE